MAEQGDAAAARTGSAPASATAPSAAATGPAGRPGAAEPAGRAGAVEPTGRAGAVEPTDAARRRRPSVLSSIRVRLLLPICVATVGLTVLGSIQTRSVANIA